MAESRLAQQQQEGTLGIGIGIGIGTIKRRGPRRGVVRRWDGAARTCYVWDHLRKDRELWFPNGDCFVYLYKKGQSKRGPSFRLQYQTLIESQCFPLLERFLSQDESHLQTSKGPGQQQQHQSHVNAKRIIEIYIPPPKGANIDQVFAYHIATRNFLAWVFRRSLVGESLGRSLTGLLHSMYQFRSETVNNIQDLMSYMDEEGYLDLANQPTHALAALSLAESFRLKDLYIRAFAHCVGMRDQLCTSPEYESTSYALKRLIRQSSIEMTDRLTTAKSMLRNFLEDALSESYIGIPPGSRAHLDRFRGFLFSFYNARLGYYPPRDFTAAICRDMRTDFEALHDLLVDDARTGSEAVPSVAAGGLCTLQLVQTFDQRHEFEQLEHPLPLLPEFKTDANPWKPWRSSSSSSHPEKLRSNQRLRAHASLIRASNCEEIIWNNELVKAYRAFEEESVMDPKKADKGERVSVVDARKIRWILVYAVYQVIRSMTNTLEEVHDAAMARYHVAISGNSNNKKNKNSSNNLPPWKDNDSIVPRRRQTDLALESPVVVWRDTSGLSQSEPGRIEIKPDIDYFALTHPTPPTSTTSSPSSNNCNNNSPNARRNSISTPPLTSSGSSTLSRALGRDSSFRRSIRMFRHSLPQPESLVQSKPFHHEILIEGYGNGTEPVGVGLGLIADIDPEQLLQSDDSPVREYSVKSHAGSSPPPGSTSSSETINDSIQTPTIATTTATPPLLITKSPPSPSRSKQSSPRRRSQRLSLHVLSRNPSSTKKPRKRPNSTIMTYEELVELQRQRDFATAAVDDVVVAVAGEHDWLVDDMKTFMGDGGGGGGDDDGSRGVVGNGWEEFADLGGLTAM